MIWLLSPGVGAAIATKPAEIPQPKPWFRVVGNEPTCLIFTVPPPWDEEILHGAMQKLPGLMRLEESTAGAAPLFVPLWPLQRPGRSLFFRLHASRRF